MMEKEENNWTKAKTLDTYVHRFLHDLRCQQRPDQPLAQRSKQPVSTLVHDDRRFETSHG